jgi:hypothetical protein
MTIRGFRSFGAKQQTLECDGPLTVVFGSNSQGKSSLVEACEFLLTGQTTRSQLHAGSKSEFAGCLRNVHLADTEEVFVEGVLEVDGTTHILRRVLVEDIDQRGQCSSTLTIDGKPAEDVSQCGIGLASPPFESPVLMQHSLRYVLATNPQSRTDYLKAVLDIADLDELRRIVASEVNALRPPTCPSLDRWQALQRDPIHGSSLGRADLKSDVSLGKCLAGALRQVVGGCPPTGEIPDLAKAMEAELERRQGAVFPIGAFKIQPPPIPSWPKFETLEALSRTSAQSKAESPGVLELLQAIVRLSELPTTDHPLDCPVCLTREALTQRRFEEIRQFLSQREKEQAALEGVNAEMVSAGTAAKRVREYLSSAQPRALAWPEAERTVHAKAAGQLRPEDGESLVQGLLRDAAELTASWNSATQSLDQAALALKAAQEGVRAGRAVDVEALRHATAQVTEAMTGLRDRVAEYVVATEAPLANLREAVEKQSNTRGWSELLQLRECYARIPKELQDRSAFEQFEKEAQTALKQIDKARGAVLDANFDTLSDEVVKWWDLLRPNEPVRFSGLRRRGSGLRFVDLKALLGSGAAARNDVERDAAGVFSDSQLNALGLAVFLARAVRDGVGLVVLDDPVSASDQEHRATFSHKVLGHLIADGAVQAIVTTHDRELNKRIHDLHDHAGIDGYEAAMDPSGGTVLIPKSDDLLSLLGEADVAVSYCLDTQLGEASDKVRKAAERLAKEIVVLNRRQAGMETTVADIDETLGELTKMATPFLTKDPSHPGKLKHAATVLNPGSHDDHRTPARQDLVVVMGDLKFLRKTYCKRTSVSAES